MLGILLAFAAAFGFGFNQIFVRLATRHFPGPVTALFAGTTGFIIAVTLALVFNLGDFKELPAIAFAWFVLLAAVHGPVARLLSFTAISMIGSARAAPLNGASPMFSAVLAIVALGERPGVLVYLGTLVVIGGMTLVVTGGMRGRNSGPQVQYNNLGYLLAICGSAGFGAVTVIVKYINTEFAPPLVTVTFSLLIGTLMLGALTHRHVASSFGAARRGHIHLTVLAGFCSGFGAIFLFSALSRDPVTLVSPIAFTAPVITLTASHFFYAALK